MVRSKLNIGFFGYDTRSWMGGINYLKNHLIALRLYDQNNEINPFIFFNENHDPEIRKMFEGLATCVVLKKRNLLPLFLKVMDKLTRNKKLFFYKYYLNKYSVNLISQSDIETKSLGIKSIGWIPDFQHMHLPELFSESELLQREIKYKRIIENSNIMITSSHDCLKDQEIFYPGSQKKTRVLHFVSQLDSGLIDLNDEYIDILEGKYGFKGKFFFLPNKFYKHKNHKIVFEAIKILKSEGISVLLICTGEFGAYESEDHIDFLRNYLDDNSLRDNVKILGVIDYKDVQYLFKNAISVLNPSLFEGWSSTVEECKIINQHLILSSIPVHKEQNPTNSTYFDPYNVYELVVILKERWLKPRQEYNFDSETILERIQNKTLAFGKEYFNIIKEAVSA